MIRKMTLGDVPIVHKIGSEVDEFRISDESSCFWPKNILEDLVKSENDVALVAEEGEIGGYLLATFHPVTKKATIENVWVSPEKPYRGNGRKLMAKAEEILKEKGAKYYSAFVEENNVASLNMCKRQGYSQGNKYHWMIKE